MLEIALEIAQYNIAYEDLATKFFEHFTYIASSLNRIGEDFQGSWDEEEGFFYDVLKMPDGEFIPVKIRSLLDLLLYLQYMLLIKICVKKCRNFIVA